MVIILKVRVNISFELRERKKGENSVLLQEAALPPYKGEVQTLNLDFNSFTSNQPSFPSLNDRDRTIITKQIANDS